MKLTHILNEVTSVIDTGQVLKDESTVELIKKTDADGVHIYTQIKDKMYKPTFYFDHGVVDHAGVNEVKRKHAELISKVNWGTPHIQLGFKRGKVPFTVV